MTQPRPARLLAAGCALLALLLLASSAMAVDPNERPISAQDLKAIIQSLRGRVVVVNFWATWCGPCRREMPNLRRLRQSFSGKELHILGISLDFDSEMYAQFVRAQRFNYPVRLGDPEIMDQMHIDAIPKTLIFDQRGVLVQNHDGPAPYAELNALVKSLLREGQFPGENL